MHINLIIIMFNGFCVPYYFKKGNFQTNRKLQRNHYVSLVLFQICNALIMQRRSTKCLLHINFPRSAFSKESHIASTRSAYMKIDAEARYLITQVSFSVIRHLLPEPRNKLHFLSSIMTMMLQRQRYFCRYLCFEIELFPLVYMNAFK